MEHIWEAQPGDHSLCLGWWDIFAGGNSSVSRGQVLVMLNKLRWQETHLAFAA